MDLYRDNYTSVNYTRLYLLFLLFLAVLYFWIGGIADNYINKAYPGSQAHANRQITIAECLLAGLDINCNLK